MSENGNQKVLGEAEATVQFWVRNARRWWAFHYALGVFGTMCSITVASSPHFLQSAKSLIETFAWISAICMALITFLMPSRKARCYVMAARLLGDALRRYKSGEQTSAKTINDAIDQGESQISLADHP